jgi:hypothetical protein
MGSNETVRIQIQIQRRGAPAIPVEAEINPIHADWLWDLFDVPPDERTGDIVLTAPISALQLLKVSPLRQS